MSQRTKTNLDFGILIAVCVAVVLGIAQRGFGHQAAIQEADLIALDGISRASTADNYECCALLARLHSGTVLGRRRAR